MARNDQQVNVRMPVITLAKVESVDWFQKSCSVASGGKSPYRAKTKQAEMIGADNVADEPWRSGIVNAVSSSASAGRSVQVL